MATRFYWHAANSSLSNLPTTTQCSLTSNKNVDAVTVNRSMNTTIGTSQVSLTLTPNSTVSSQNYYFCRFASPQLAAQTISANTWNVYFAASESNTRGNFPVSGNNQTIPICCYVWRPGTGKVANILDGNSAAEFNEPPTTSNVEYPKDGTFSGSAVTCQDGDVIVYEVWFITVLGQTGTYTHIIYFDGTATTPSEAGATSMSSCAAYVETPQNLTFYTPAITATPNKVTVQNKFITKI